MDSKSQTQKNKLRDERKGILSDPRLLHYEVKKVLSVSRLIVWHFSGKSGGTSPWNI